MSRMPFSLAPLLLAGLIMAAAPVAALAQGQGGEQAVDAPKGVWAKRCDGPAGTPQERCFIAQRIVVKDRGPILQAVAGNVGEEGDQPVLVLTVPLGILLQPGVSLVVDEGEPMGFPVRVCITGGCRVVVPMDDGLLTALKRGKTLRVAFIDGGSGRTLAVPVGLDGFTSAWNSLED